MAKTEKPAETIDTGGLASKKTLLDENAQCIMAGMAANEKYAKMLRHDPEYCRETAAADAYQIAADMIVEKRRREADGEDPT